MTAKFKRRDFLKTTAAAGVGTLASGALPSISFGRTRVPQAGKPVVVSSANGLKATALAMDMIQQGVNVLIQN